MTTAKRVSRSGSEAKRKTLGPDGRAKAASIFLREERKSDKRQTLAEALATNLRSKYAKGDSEFGDSITSMTNRLVLHSQRRIGESDIVALEAVVKKMSQERAAMRSSKARGSSSGPDIQQINESRATGSGQSKIQPPHDPTDTLPNELQGQDEWVLLNALTLVEFEKDKNKEKTKHLEKQRMQRAWLDAQRNEKESRKSLDKQQQHKHYENQIRDLTKWRSEESLKKQRQLDQVMKVRAERDEQLRQQKIHQEQAETQRRHDEEAELQRVKKELKKLEEDALQRRQAEHERVRRLQQENAKELSLKSRLKQQEQEEDVKLMEAYAQRLAREEEERMRGLQSKLKRRDLVQNGVAASLQVQQRKRALEDERRAEEYQQKKDEEARAHEQQAAEKRRREALERKQFLELQRRQKKEREHQEVVEDLVYAGHVQRDTKAAQEEKRLRAQALRQRNLQEQERLLQQMAEQKAGQPMSPLHLPRTLMNSREKHINAKLLQKLEEPELAMQVLKKLSPSKEQKEYTSSTSFY